MAVKFTIDKCGKRSSVVISRKDGPGWASLNIGHDLDEEEVEKFRLWAETAWAELEHFAAMEVRERIRQHFQHAVRVMP